MRLAARTAGDKPLPYPKRAMKPSTEQTSYPKRKHIRLPVDAYHKPGAWYFITICCRNKEPRFQSAPLRDLVQEVLHQTAAAHYVEVAAYSILPDHLHLICSAGPQGVPGFMRAFKSKTALEISRRIGESSPWQARFFDHKLRSDESLRQKCEYIWMNPVRRALVRRPEDYPWSGVVRSG